MAKRKPHELTIRVMNGGSGGGGGASSGDGSGKPKAEDSVWDLMKNSIAAREIKSVTRQAVSFAVSNVALTTGNSLSQERMEVAINTGAKGIAYGIALGKGNFALAAIMAVNDTVSAIMSATRLRLENQVERESLSLSRDRAGIAFNYSRMGGAK